MALLKVFQLANVKFWVKWNVTGIDPPELVYFARKQIEILKSQGIHVYRQMYEKSMMELIIHHQFPPTRLYRYCCLELKERVPKDHKGSMHSFGVRKAESSKRNNRNELEIIHKNKDKRLSIPNKQLGTEQMQLEVMLNNDNGDNRKQFENCLTKGLTFSPQLKQGDS